MVKSIERSCRVEHLERLCGGDRFGVMKKPQLKHVSRFGRGQTPEKMIIQFSVLLLSIRMLLGVHLSCSMQRCWPRGFVSGTEASLLLADCGRCHPIENFEKRFAWMAIRCIEIVGWKLLVDDAVQQMATNNWVCRIALMTQTRNKKKSPSFECPVSNGHSNFEASVYGPNRSTYYELS